MLISVLATGIAAHRGRCGRAVGLRSGTQICHRNERGRFLALVS